MSALVYNGVTLPYPMTTQFNQEVVYDKQADTDWVCTKYDIEVDGIINVAYLGTLFPTHTFTRPPDTAEIMQIMRAKLMKPRKALSFKVNRVELIPRPQSNLPGTVDAMNGPKPQYCNITQLTAETFWFSYRIIANHWERLVLPGEITLPLRNQEGNPVLWNRWTETVEIDNCDYSTRTREGTYMIRSDNMSGAIAHQFSTDFAVLSIPHGFTRKSRRFTQSADGLSVQYQMVDQEEYKLPPSPAYEADGYYSETVLSNGVKRFGEVQVHLKGAKTSKQTDLIRAAVTVAMETIRARGRDLNIEFPPTGTPFVLLQGATIRRGLYANNVEVLIRGQFQQVDKRYYGLAGFVGMTTATPLSEVGSDIANVPPYKERGTAGLLLQAAAYYDPSLGTTKMGPGLSRWTDNPPSTLESKRVQMNAGMLPGQAGKTLED